LIYDQGCRDFYVEIRANKRITRRSVAAAIKKNGSQSLRLAIVDMFK
jgi:hypothetical protein